MSFKSLIEGYSKPQELVRVKQLIDICELDQADQIIKEFEEKEGHTPLELIICNLLKCEILSTRGLHEKVVKLAEQTYKESLKLERNLLPVDLLLTMALSLLCLYQTEKAHDITKQGEELLKTLTPELSAEYKQREARIAFLRGWYYVQKVDDDQALKQFELSLSIRKELDIKHEIAMSLFGISHVFLYRKGDLILALNSLEQSLIFAEESGDKYVAGGPLFYMAQLHSFKGELDRSIMYAERSLTIFNDVNDKYMMSRILNTLGGTYMMKGELDHAIRFYEQILELIKQFDNKYIVSGIYNSLSSSYRMKGKLDHALEYVEQSMAINRELGALDLLANNHDSLIQILIDRGDLEQAWNSLRDLEQLNSQLKNKQINLMYLLDKAQVLKTSSRALNRGKAEEIFKQLLEEKDLIYEGKIKVLLNLCELLLTDLRITNEAELLDEIKPLITQILDLSEKSQSFWILGETYLLQAKLALINLEVIAARRFLTQAQKIAESYGIKRLAMKISHEHDELIKQQKVWEKLKESEASLSERWELAGLNKQMEDMVRKQIINLPEVSDEDPILLLIISEGGIPLFSQSFIEEKSIDSQIFGGFLTTIDYFIKEMFSEGLDRAMFGDYTLLVKSVSPFFITYIFKGDSYYANQKIKYFIDFIQDKELIWQNLVKFNQINKALHKDDIPLLDSLITDIFVKKSFKLKF